MSEIAWAITRNNSAFLLKKRNCPKPFSTDPMNLTNKHSQRYTGLVNKKAVAVAPAADNKGFTVTIKGGKGSFCYSNLPSFYKKHLIRNDTSNIDP